MRKLDLDKFKSTVCGRKHNEVELPPSPNDIPSMINLFEQGCSSNTTGTYKRLYSFDLFICLIDSTLFCLAHLALCHCMSVVVIHKCFIFSTSSPKWLDEVMITCLCHYLVNLHFNIIWCIHFVDLNFTRIWTRG